MEEESGYDPTVPFLPTLNSDHNENTSGKKPKSSWFSNCFPFLGKSLDEIPRPTSDQIDLEQYYRIELPQATIYFRDLEVGSGKAVMMEEEPQFHVQEVEYNYNRYNKSAELVKSSDGSPLTYCFCHNSCPWLGRGVQGMTQGGIRRIVIVPPQHKSAYTVLPPGHKSVPSDFGVPDCEIWDLQLLNVGISKFCKMRHMFPAGRNNDAEGVTTFHNFLL